MNRWLLAIAVTGIAVVTLAHVLNRSVTDVAVAEGSVRAAAKADLILVASG